MLKSPVIYIVDLPLCSIFSNIIHVGNLEYYFKLHIQMIRQSWVQNVQEVSEERVLKLFIARIILI